MQSMSTSTITPIGARHRSGSGNAVTERGLGSYPVAVGDQVDSTVGPSPVSNCAFNVDAYMGHAFGMFMAHVGTLRTSCFGAS
jgi:hypothetical protein